MTSSNQNFISPPPLARGDLIAIGAYSSGIGAHVSHRVERAAEWLRSKGFSVRVMPTAKTIDEWGSSASPQERATELNALFADDTVKGIVAAIGGITQNQILPLLDYELIRSNPKIFCGFSDNTHLCHALFSKAGLGSFYGPTAITNLGDSPAIHPYTAEHFLHAVGATGPGQIISPSSEWSDDTSRNWFTKDDLKRPREFRANQDGHRWLAPGEAEGRLIGGCLFSLCQLKGTDYLTSYDDALLFIESCEGEDYRKGQPLSFVEAQYSEMKLSGAFERARGFIIGRPFGYTDEERAKYEKLVVRTLSHYQKPILYNVNVGHCDPIISVPFGGRARISSLENRFEVVGW